MVKTAECEPPQTSSELQTNNVESDDPKTKHVLSSSDDINSASTETSSSTVVETPDTSAVAAAPISWRTRDRDDTSAAATGLDNQIEETREQIHIHSSARFCKPTSSTGFTHNITSTELSALHAVLGEDLSILTDLILRLTLGLLKDEMDPHSSLLFNTDSESFTEFMKELTTLKEVHQSSSDPTEDTQQPLTSATIKQINSKKRSLKSLSRADYEKGIREVKTTYYHCSICKRYLLTVKVVKRESTEAADSGLSFTITVNYNAIHGFDLGCSPVSSKSSNSVVIDTEPADKTTETEEIEENIIHKVPRYRAKKFAKKFSLQYRTLLEKSTTPTRVMKRILRSDSLTIQRNNALKRYHRNSTDVHKLCQDMLSEYMQMFGITGQESDE